MLKTFAPLVCLGILGLLASCQSTSSASETPVQLGANNAMGSTTETEARDIIATYIKGQSNAGLYVLDSAQVMDADTLWQVLIPRTDWAGRMPNRAAFNVSKRTGQVMIQPVK